MRILVTGFTANYGGIETFIMNYYKAMKEIDNTLIFDFTCADKEIAFKEDIFKMGGRVHLVSRPRMKKKLQYEFTKILTENNYDVLWCNKCELYEITPLIMAKKYGVKKIILHSHNSNNMHSGLRKIYVQLLHDLNKKKIPKLATDFWACSDYAANWMFLDDKYELVPNAVDMDNFKFDSKKREDYRKELDIENKLVIGTVGRFSYQKNPEFLLEIFKEIHNQNKNSVLLWVGIGELQESIKEKIKQYKLEENVKILGRRHDVSELMQAMDCFLLPSRFEGLPVVAIEAQATGLTVFAAKDGITEQTKITDSLKFISLSQTPKQWADEILKSDLTHKYNTEKIIKNGFEIKSATQNLLKRLGD